MAPMQRQGPGRRTWLILSVCLTLLMVSYTYGDNTVITLHGMNVWSALRDGELLHFYQYNDGVAPPNEEFHSVPIIYGFLTFLFIAIWNLPLWLLQEFAGVNVFTSVLCLAWMKVINVLFMLGTAWLVQRISLHLAPTSRWVPWSGFFFLTSGFLVAAVFVMVQFDIIYMFFAMLGLYFVVHDRRKAFVVAFAVAVAIKWFPLFVFLPVLLLVEKRISRILLCLVGALSVAFAFKIPFLFSENPSAEVGSELIRHMVLTNRLPLGLEGVPTFAVLFGLVCIASFVHRPADPPALNRAVIYAGFAGVASFFVAAPAFPYWFALMCPFIAILWATHPGLSKVTLLIETGLVAALIVQHQVHFYWTYDLDVVSPMLLPRLFEPVDSLAQQVTPTSLYTRLGLVPYISMLGAVFTAGMVALLVLFCPRAEGAVDDPAAGDDHHVKALIYGRGAVMMALMLVPAAAYFYSLLVRGTTT